jgi:hypothetical protein
VKAQRAVSSRGLYFQSYPAFGLKVRRPVSALPPWICWLSWRRSRAASTFIQFLTNRRGSVLADFGRGPPLGGHRFGYGKATVRLPVERTNDAGGPVAKAARRSPGCLLPLPREPPKLGICRHARKVIKRSSDRVDGADPFQSGREGSLRTASRNN